VPGLDQGPQSSDARLDAAQQSRQRGLAIEEQANPEILTIVLDQIEGIEDRGNLRLPRGGLKMSRRRSPNAEGNEIQNPRVANAEDQWADPGNIGISGGSTALFAEIKLCDRQGPSLLPWRRWSPRQRPSMTANGMTFRRT
jgi:hypothetical protein